MPSKSIDKIRDEKATEFLKCVTPLTYKNCRKSFNVCNIMDFGVPFVNNLLYLEIPVKFKQLAEGLEKYKNRATKIPEKRKTTKTKQGEQKANTTRQGEQEANTTKQGEQEANTTKQGEQEANTTKQGEQKAEFRTISKIIEWANMCSTLISPEQTVKNKLSTFSISPKAPGTPGKRVPSSACSPEKIEKDIEKQKRVIWNACSTRAIDYKAMLTSAITSIKDALGADKKATSVLRDIRVRDCLEKIKSLIENDKKEIEENIKLNEHWRPK